MPSLTLISLDENLEKLNILKPLNGILEIKDIKKIKSPKLTFNPYRKQYFSTSLLHFLELQRKDPQEIILGIINNPIYTPGLASTIGESSPKRGVAVVSAYLLNNNEIIKEAFHEIGHIFLLNHCDSINCFMHCLEDKRISQKQEFCQNCEDLIRKNKAKLNFLKNFESLSLVYSSKKVNFGEHIFPVEKYSLIYQVLKENRLFKNTSFYEAPEAEFKDLLLAHDLEYLNDLKELKLTPRTLFSEIPINKEIMDFFISHVGGTILASFLALKEGAGINLGGGFHHAFSEHAEGFCYLNDIAIAVKKLKKENLVKKVLIIDCDLHQGNGTAKIFHDDEDVFTFSIHQENNYPIKEESNLDIGLPDKTDDQIYLKKLRQIVPPLLGFFDPDFIFYIAGADPYKEDILGGLNLTINGLKERDELIFSQAFQRKIPIVSVLAGGYAKKIKDLIKIHFNTCLTALKVFGNFDYNLDDKFAENTNKDICQVDI